jgi:hypothetical protein
LVPVEQEHLDKVMPVGRLLELMVANIKPLEEVVPVVPEDLVRRAQVQHHL